MGKRMTRKEENKRDENGDSEGITYEERKDEGR